MDLDDLLDRSAAVVSPRTPELRQELQTLLANAERAARPGRRRLRALSVAGATVGALTLGTATAMAAGLVPTPAWVPWTTGTGSACHMEFIVTKAGPDGPPLSRTYPEAEKQHAVQVAQAFLARLDYTTIDKDAAIRDFQRGEDAAIAHAALGEQQPRLHGDDLEITAVGQVVWQRLDRYLNEQHIPSELVFPSQAWRCGQ